MTSDASEVPWDVRTVSGTVLRDALRRIMTRGVMYLCVPHYRPPLSFSFFFPGKEELPDPEVLVERLLKRRTFRPDPQGTNLMFAFFAQHFTHQFFKTYNRMGLGFTKALDHGVGGFSRRRGNKHHLKLVVILTEEKRVGYKSEWVEKGASAKYNRITY